MCVPGDECVASSRIQGVDVTVGVVEGAVPQVLGQLQGHLPLGQSHLTAVPHIHLTAKVKDQHLHTHTNTHTLMITHTVI